MGNVRQMADFFHPNANFFCCRGGSKFFSHGHILEGTHKEG